jgi:UDP-GlcNAc:undecaprenyl-phosphate GlcNAc-1-phosphate transferase
MMPDMVWIILALVGVGLAISLPVTALVRTVGRRLGAFDTGGAPGHIKTLRQVPNNGGIAIFLAVALPLVAGLVALRLFDVEFWSRWLPDTQAILDRVTQQTTPTAVVMLAAMAALLVIGWIDDRRSLNPWIKLAVEIVAALVLAVWFEVRLLDLEMLPVWVSIVITVLWIVAVTNAINFMDNMDGLAAGVSAIAAALFMVACLVNKQWFVAATLAVLVGGLIGFLVFNFPPATIFMGDRGSLVIGFVLAVLTVRTTYYDPTLGGGWYAVFMPLVVLAIPLYDLCSVTLIRIWQGRSPLVGDQQHFSHRLVQRGLSPRGAVVVIWSATAVTGIGGVALGSLEAWQAILVGVQTGLVLLMIALLDYASRHAPAARRAAETTRAGTPAASRDDAS